MTSNGIDMCTAASGEKKGVRYDGLHASNDMMAILFTVQYTSYPRGLLDATGTAGDDTFSPKLSVGGSSRDSASCPTRGVELKRCVAIY